MADTETPVLFVKKDQKLPGLIAEIYYNGTGQLKGRWEVVFPGEEPPTARDLLTEASLPIEERGLQRRYTEVSRFNTFLPPTGLSITPVLFVKKDQKLPGLIAEIYYNGTGQLKGRWEVVFPGEEPPTARDLLTEASLPIEERGLQRRYTEVSRFNTFLPPTGKTILPGPDSKKLPTSVDGLYMLLLRIEASADKEGDSNLAAVGGTGVVHSGAVAGFPIPPFRYYVGNSESEMLTTKEGKLQLLQPNENAILVPDKPIDFSWVEIKQAAVYKLEAKDSNGLLVLSALLQSGINTYRAPSWLTEKLPDGQGRWRISVLNFSGKEIQSSDWRRFRIGSEK